MDPNIAAPIVKAQANPLNWSAAAVTPVAEAMSAPLDEFPSKCGGNTLQPHLDWPVRPPSPALGRLLRARTHSNLAPHQPIHRPAVAILRSTDNRNETAAISCDESLTLPVGAAHRMLWTVFVILLILWLIGWIGFHVIGWYIHLLLIAALIVLLVQLFSGGRRAV